jgi:hypothetical protein
MNVFLSLGVTWCRRLTAGYNSAIIFHDDSTLRALSVVLDEVDDEETVSVYGYEGGPVIDNNKCCCYYYS